MKIDLDKFKEKYNVNKIDVSPEPEIFEKYVKETFANKIGFDEYYYEPDSSSGESEMTVIVHHKIPMDCITIVDK